jgi:hypothetical protein
MFRRFVAALLIVSLALPAHAGMIATDQGRMIEFLDRAEVQSQLQAYGVSAAEVKARVAALTDEEAAELSARIDTLPAGGVNIISAILIVFLVLLLTDILGFTKVFPFTRPVR